MPIVIRSMKEGFRRCGTPHSKSPVPWPDDSFSREELELLQNEPMLSVHIVREDPKEKLESNLDPAILAAARKAIENGNVIGSGAPDIKAMEKILEKDVTADQRDQAFEIIQAEGKE